MLNPVSQNISCILLLFEKQLSMDEWKQFIQEVSDHLSTAQPSDDEEMCKKVSYLVQQLQPEKSTNRRYYYNSFASVVCLYSNMLLLFQNFT